MLTIDYDKLALEPRERVLDLGCGQGRHTFEALRKGAWVVSFDLSLKCVDDVGVFAGALAHEEDTSGAWSGVAGDALNLPFADDSFEVVIASEVLEHIPADEQAMSELARILVPGGRLVVSVPRYWPERVCWSLSRAYHSNEGGHVRIYRAPSLVAKLRAAGFIFRHKHHAHALHSPYWWLKCAFGVDRKNALLPRLYHRFLVWDLRVGSAPVRRLEKVLNPIAGKSVVLYLENDGKEVALRAA